MHVQPISLSLWMGLLALFGCSSIMGLAFWMVYFHAPCGSNGSMLLQFLSQDEFWSTLGNADAMSDCCHLFCCGGMLWFNITQILLFISGLCLIVPGRAIAKDDHTCLDCHTINLMRFLHCNARLLEQVEWAILVIEWSICHLQHNASQGCIWKQVIGKPLGQFWIMSMMCTDSISCQTPHAMICHMYLQIQSKIAIIKW